MMREPYRRAARSGLAALVVVTALVGGVGVLSTAKVAASRRPIPLTLSAGQPIGIETGGGFSRCGSKFIPDLRQARLFDLGIDNHLRPASKPGAGPSILPLLPQGATIQLRVSNRSGQLLRWAARDWGHHFGDKCSRLVADAYGWITTTKGNLTPQGELIDLIVDERVLPKKAVVEVREVIPGGARGPVRAIALPPATGGTSGLTCFGLYLTGIGKTILKGVLSLMGDVLGYFPNLKAASAVASVVSMSVNYLDESVNGSVTTGGTVKYIYKADKAGRDAAAELAKADLNGEVRIISQTKDALGRLSVVWKPVNAAKAVLTLKTLVSYVAEGKGVYDTVKAICG